MSRTVGWMLSIAAFAVVVCVIVVAGMAVNANRVTVAEAPQVPGVQAPLRAAGASQELDDGSSGEPIADESELAAQVAAVMDAAAKDPALGRLTAVVSSARTGDVLWEQGSAEPSRPASSLKILTAAAALLELDHDKTVATRVVRYPGQDGVVLVGAGDPTLSVDGAGFYPGAASIAEIAEEVRASLGVAEGQPVPQDAGASTVYVDRSLFRDTFHSTWERDGIEDGYIAPVEPVMVDGARLSLDREDARRTPEPAAGAGQALATAMGVANVEVLAPEETAQSRFGGEPEVLAEVESAPLSERVHQMMTRSDNVLAESLAREVAVSRGLTPDFAGAAKAVADVLAEHGLALENTGSSAANLADSSGLSVDNRVTPAQLDRVLLAATGRHPGIDGAEGTGAAEGDGADDADELTAKLRPLLDALPVGGVSGTLAERYSGSDGAGWVRAKTGTLDGTSALAGYTVTQGGDVLTFVLLSNEASLLPARAAADAAATGLHDIA
ncbi:D-alanyl-D-alanine carboxypeptidase/D-alanyl-D-alanine-endopeptidase [Corynebacterium sp. HMSC11E11]|uniref:D-alanyl-D-alanine carboxypeptidase/D-alanyl-D-alanine-endopeptidase n=1 Tax=Corynebacterium sp. HMSC11E11 TaxID=1581089 RepID=UPI000A7BD286|nr:D-alanyl-D-alanine carboxypeptidase [Corynebacterium sp. HMSC11E11]